MKHFINLLLILWPLLLVSHLFLVVDESAGLTAGVRLDYLMPKLWAVSGMSIAIIAVSVGYHWQKCIAWAKSYNAVLLLGTLGSVTVAQYLASPLPLTSVLQLWQLILGVAAALCVHQWTHHTPNRTIVLIGVVISLTFQTAVASYQWVYQQSVGEYWLLGEPRLSAPFGLARVDETWVLPYGTTAHPNVLAGSVVLLSCIAAQLFARLHTAKKFRLLFFLYCCACQGIVLLLARSWSAGAAAGIFWLLWALQSTGRRHQATIAAVVAISVCVVGSTTLLFYPKSPWYFPFAHDSIVRRRELLEAYSDVIASNYWLGVGSSMGTKALSQHISSYPGLARFVQPVHNVPVLWFVETGILGVVILVLFCSRVSQGTVLRLLPTVAILTPLLIWDHYLLSFIPAWTLGWWFVFQITSD